MLYVWCVRIIEFAIDFGTQAVFLQLNPEIGRVCWVFLFLSQCGRSGVEQVHRWIVEGVTAPGVEFLILILLLILIHCSDVSTARGGRCERYEPIMIKSKIMIKKGDQQDGEWLSVTFTSTVLSGHATDNECPSYGTRDQPSCSAFTISTIAFLPSA